MVSILRSCRFLALVAVLSWVLAAGGAAQADGGWVHDSMTPVAEGVFLSEHTRGDPVRSLALHVPPGAPVRLAPVVAGDRIGDGLETVSSMCTRVGAVACVNANFSVCPDCQQPFGAVVRDGVILRTPVPHQDTVSIIGGRLTSEPWTWRASLRVAVPDPGGAPAVGIDAVNSVAGGDGIVMHTSAYGPRTHTATGGYEVTARAPVPLHTGPDQRQRIELIGASMDGGAAIPADGIVLSGVGAGAERLRRFVEQHGAAPLDLVVDSPAGLEQTISGHPILLRDGVPTALDAGDAKVTRRHPRTLIGWDDHGAVWIVVVDGRQDHSQGLSLADAAEHLRQLGATHAVNLDGGGSSTMVARCPDSLGLCVRNQPSDGRERSVTVALAVFGTLVAPPPPPPPEPAPPMTVLAEAAEAPVVPTTAAPPPPTPPTTEAAAVPAPEDVRRAVPAWRLRPAEAEIAGAALEQRVVATLPDRATDTGSARSVLALVAAALVLAEAAGVRRLQRLSSRSSFHDRKRS